MLPYYNLSSDYNLPSYHIFPASPGRLVRFYTFSTVLMAFLASSILILLISLAFLNRNVLANAGSRLLAVLSGVVILRLLLPIEFPFTVNVNLPPILSDPLVIFCEPCIELWGIHVSCWQIFELIWVCGILVNLALGIRGCLLSRSYILKYGTDMTDTARYKEPLDSICAQYGKSNPFRVIELKGLDIPTLFCLRKPYILIPKDRNIPADKLPYILRHEALHYFHHDHLTKPAVRLLSVVYWWNPACILLRKQTNLLLEMAVDRRVVGGDPAVREEYADCLLYVRRQALAAAPQTPGYLRRDSTFLVRPRNRDLKKRCVMLFHSTSPGKRMTVTFLLTALVAGTYLASHLYILQADSIPQELIESAIVPTQDNTYIIQLDSGGYEIYTDGMYLETVTSLDYYDNGTKIYNEEGELVGEIRTALDFPLFQ